LRERFPTYASFGASRLDDILSQSDLLRANVLSAYDFASSVAINRGDGTFALRPLPMEAQISPVFASLAGGFTGNGGIDLLLAGNDFGVPPLYGRYDASYGVLLRGAGGGRFQPVDLTRSGLVLDGQVRHMKMLRAADGGRLIVVARNGGALQILRVSTPVHNAP
ncbi:MAG TPA: hypothetical protein VF159_13655, partial [Gemmatimonadaceae bacterium]